MGGQFSSSDSRRAARLAQWVTWLSRGSPAVTSSDEQASDGDNEGSRKKHVYWEGWLTCSTSLAVESILAMTMLSWSCTLHKIRDIHSNIHGGLTTASKSGEQVKKNSRAIQLILTYPDVPSAPQAFSCWVLTQPITIFSMKNNVEG